jgi:hypothetical protein
MEVTSRNHNSIILMDEPDAALSIVGQRNLLAVFESLVSPDSSNGTCQLIYTTHSPYLINRNFPRRIRVVKKEDSEQGTQYIEQARVRRYEPVRTALGIDSAPSLLLGFDNVLLEGATDQYLIAELVRLFATPATVGDLIDLNEVILVSADGATNVANVLEQSCWADEPIPPTVILLDSDNTGRETVAAVTGERGGRKLIDREFVKLVGELVESSNVAVTSIEDILPKDLYGEAVETYIRTWLPETYKVNGALIHSTVSESNFGSDGLVKATSALFKELRPEFGTDYDKMGVLREAVAIVDSRICRGGDDQLLSALRSNVVRICDFIRQKLETGRTARAKIATTQTIKRLVDDFNRLYRKDVSITDVQKLLRRIEAEIVPIGSDGEGLLQVVRGYLGQLEKLRTTGQTRLKDDGWSPWKQRLESMKRNPLALTRDERPPAASSNDATGGPAERLARGQAE